VRDAGGAIFFVAGAVQVLRPQLPQTLREPPSDRSLSDRLAQHLLRARIAPAVWQRIDNCVPNAALDRIRAARWFRATGPGHWGMERAAADLRATTTSFELGFMKNMSAPSQSRNLGHARTAGDLSR
jgi:hypothetical protein